MLRFAQYDLPGGNIRKQHAVITAQDDCSWSGVRSWREGVETFLIGT